MNEGSDDYDSPWKKILEAYFREFVVFFFPAAAEGIDWSRGYVFLDKELQNGCLYTIIVFLIVMTVLWQALLCFLMKGQGGDRIILDMSCGDAGSG
jgi:hypothetical protein